MVNIINADHSVMPDSVASAQPTFTPVTYLLYLLYSCSSAVIGNLFCAVFFLACAHNIIWVIVIFLGYFAALLGLTFFISQILSNVIPNVIPNVITSLITNVMMHVLSILFPIISPVGLTMFLLFYIPAEIIYNLLKEKFNAVRSSIALRSADSVILLGVTGLLVALHMIPVGLFALMIPMAIYHLTVKNDNSAELQQLIQGDSGTARYVRANC